MIGRSQLRLQIAVRSGLEVSPQLQHCLVMRAAHGLRIYPESLRDLRDLHVAVVEHRQYLALARRQQTQAVSHDGMAAIPENRPSPEDAADAKERLVLLRGLVEQLPVRTRQAFILIRIEGRSYADAALLMGVSISSVQKHMHQAMDYLSKRLRN